MFRQTDVQGLREHEDQEAADDACCSDDQRRQEKPDVLQEHDHRRQGAPDPTEAAGEAHPTLPVQDHTRDNSVGPILEN